jgi:hypothetical protein
MRFVLKYRGPLKSNGDRKHKHKLRQHFHQQLKRLWEQQPLSELKPFWLQPERASNNYHFLRPMGDFTFAPLITMEANTVAEVSITFLRPEPPGQLITQGGDIDNQLKTLFDALTIPRHANSLPPGTAPGDDETPLFCLLEDDNLIVSVAVRTEQWLEPVEDRSIVDVTIAVETRVTRVVFDNAVFI